MVLRADSSAMVSAVILHFHREHLLPATLDRVVALPVDEIIVVDNGSDGGLRALEARYDRMRVLDPGANLGIAGRNLAAREARGEILLMLDDDAYPRPGAVESALEAFAREPSLAVIGGLVRDVDDAGRVKDSDSVGSFDWFLRAGQQGDVPPTGFPAFFFPEGASFHRRSAFLGVGGYFEPFFGGCVELDLATRLIATGWDVRYLPTAVFDHRKVRLTGEAWGARLRLRIRNQIWYFWLRFPPAKAALRIPAYLGFDFVECAARGTLGAWTGGIADAWLKRATVRSYRAPLPRDALRRAEMNRGRMHVRLLAGKLVEKLHLSR
jgi:GT2 family glycosyltransferase